MAKLASPKRKPPRPIAFTCSHEPDKDFPARLAYPSFCAVPTDTPFAPQRAQPIPSAGPYYIASYTPKERLVLLRNPNYRGPRQRRSPSLPLRPARH